MLEVIFNTNGVRTTLHDTNDKTTLTVESSAASKLEGTVYTTDESADNLFPGLTEVLAYDTFTNEVVFEGTLYSAKPTMDQDGAAYVTFTCSHLLSRLSTASVVGFEDASGNVRTMVQRILDIYNSTALDNHKIYMGACPTTGGHPDVVHIFSATCFDAITQIVVTEAGWEFKASYRDGHWYLDVADDFGEWTSTDIISGVNMLSLSKTLDASELYTRIIPIGSASYIPDAYRNPVMSTVSGTDGMPLTLYNYDQSNPGKIYIANTALESKYPILAKVVQYDDISATDETDFNDAQSKLYAKGAADAAKLTDIIEAYETTAIDLSRAGYNFEALELNRMYHIVNAPLKIDTWLKVSSKKIDYSNPAKSELTFGPIGRSAARYLSRKGKSTDQRLNDIGTAAYRTTNTRTDGMSLRNTTKSHYDDSSHNATTLYTVSDESTGKVELYLGDTKISGEGGEEGDIWNVSTAVILNNGNFDNFVITEEEMAEISETTKFYYGATSRFIVLQGHLCYFGNGNTSSAGTLPPKLDGSTENFQAVLDNAEYFSSVSYSGMLSPEHTLMSYPSGNDDTFVRYWSWATTVYTADWRYSTTDGEYVTESLRFFASRWTLDTGEKPTELKFYDDLTAEEKAAVVNNRTWYNMDTYYTGSVYENGTYKLTNFAPSWFVLPVVQYIYDTVTTPNGYPTPYGYATIENLYLIANDEYMSRNSTPSGASLAGNSAWNMPFASQAEHDLAFSLTRRSIPQEVTPNA